MSKSISNTIAEDEIDGYVVYRLMKPVYNWWKSIGIYQRNLVNYNESLLMHSRSFGEGCPNCHSFVGNDPDTITIGLRSAVYGSSTLLAQNGTVSKIGSKWGYTAWHPSGTLAVYSINKVRQFFHTGRMEVRDVVDLDSALVCYMAEGRKAVCPAQLSEKNRLETYPTWSPDGKAHKPFVLPQPDPIYYDSLLKTYSVPELVSDRVRVSKSLLGRAARNKDSIAVEVPITAATPKAVQSEPWQERE